MAAYSVLISLRETLKDFIQSDPHQIFECRNGRHLFESLQRNVIFMLERFDIVPRKVGKWEEKIQDSCNEAESIIEDYIARTIRRKGEVLREWLYCICECKKQSSLYSQIYQIGAVIDSIVNEMKSEIVLDDTGKEASNGDDSYLRDSSHPNQQKQRLFGFENHFKEIKSRLLYDTTEKLEVVAIVGMGGIGKTSLATALFDDESIVPHFDVCRSVKVSQSYDVNAILLGILGDENSSCDTNVETNVINYRVYQLLYRKRYLIVLDDIWDSKAWEDVRMHLPDCENKSRVLLTTRNKDVARYTMPLGPIYDLQLLDKGTSWSMLKHRVFGEEECPLELVEIGQKIAEGCHGLPLAIVVIAGILVNVNRTRNSWDEIANDVSKVVETGDEKFSQVLALSYHHLPHYLRPYFLYMTSCKAVYNTNNLVNGLISERFLKPKKSYECDVKEIVLECLKELLDRNLIIVTERKYNGKAISYGIHDLVRDLIIKVVKEEKFFYRDPFVGAAEIISTTRRAHFHEKPLLNSVNQLHLRTVICCSKDVLATLERCHHLRILIADVILPLNMLFERLELCHLRHLHLTVSKDERFGISSAISKLVNLEYLTIVCDWGSRDSIVTIDIWKFPKLRSFNVPAAVMLPHPVVKTSSPFLNLRDLHGIANFRFTKDTVKLIPKVRRMGVHYSVSSCAGSWSYFGFENLCHLTHLERLGLCFLSGSYELMNYATFPSSLKSFVLAGKASGVTWEYITKKIGSLPNLEKLRLRAHAVCDGDVWEINEGFFKKLKVLEVSEACLKCLKTDGSGNAFPNLERLILIACPCLTDLPDDIVDISTLELILVDDYQEAIVNWAEEIKQFHLDNGGNEDFRIIVFKIAAEVKKYQKKKSNEDEMLEETETTVLGEAADLGVKLAAELMKKYQPFELKESKECGEALDLWVKFEQDRPDNGNKFFRILFAKVAADLKGFKEVDMCDMVEAGVSLQAKVGEDQPNNGDKLFEVSIPINVADLKKYVEKESKGGEMFDHAMGETPSALQINLVVTIARELMKYQPFELGESNKSKIQVFWEMTIVIFAELTKYEEEEKEHKTFYQQEAIELFRDIVLKIFEVLKKYEEESEEQKMCYYQEAHKLLRVIVLRIVLEIGKFVENVKKDDIFLKTCTYLMDNCFIDENPGLYHQHVVRSIGFIHPDLGRRLGRIKSPLSDLREWE